jgi:hypothetical protein
MTRGKRNFSNSSASSEKDEAFSCFGSEKPQHVEEPSALLMLRVPRGHHDLSESKAALPAFGSEDPQHPATFFVSPAKIIAGGV